MRGECARGGGGGNSGGDERVEMFVGGGGELMGCEADVRKGRGIDAHDLSGVLDQLMDGKGSVVGFNNGIGHLGGWHDGESAHDPVGVFLSDLGDQKSSHAGAGSSSERVGDLETLEAIAAFSLLPHNIED